MMILSQYHIFELDTINIYSVFQKVFFFGRDFKGKHSISLTVYSVHLTSVNTHTYYNKLKSRLVDSLCRYMYSYLLHCFIGSRIFTHTRIFREFSLYTVSSISPEGNYKVGIAAMGWETFCELKNQRRWVRKAHGP